MTARLLVLLWSFSAVAAAADPDGARCTVLSIHALAEPGGIDPKLEPLRAKLTAGPFQAYKTFKLLAEAVAEPRAGQAADTRLPNERTLKLAFLEKVQEGKRTRLRLAAEMAPALKNVAWKADEGDALLLVVDRFQGGALAVAISCRAR